MAAQHRILLVDDDPGLLRLLALRLKGADYQVDTADSGAAALGRVPGFRPHLVITDLRMDGMDGLALFDTLHAQDPSLPVIIMTAHGTIPEAVAATQRGVFAYLTKPFDSKLLLAYVAQALALSGSGDGVESGPGERWRAAIKSRSPAMEELLRQARLVADSDASVLIQGESGTGKELLARAIHDASTRAGQPFVAVNCNAIPEPLLESELFGHVKGSFTGATQSYKGLFQAAHRGTLFLDEIGDMPLGFQVKLLRALQQREVRPVGSTDPVAIDLRIVSATHRNLETEVTQGRFREDLYYRLNVVLLELPPLRRRREDIPLLTAHFLEQLKANARKHVQGFAHDAMALLTAAPWPGNVRQLANVIEQAMALATTPIIPASLVSRALRDKAPAIVPLAEARDRFERDYLAQLLRVTEGNVTQAAKLAQRNRTEFYKLLHRYHLDPELFREASSEPGPPKPE